MDAAATLIGTRVRRFDALDGGLLVFTLHGADVHGALIVGVSQAARGVGWIERRPGGRAHGTFALQGKRALEGARIADIAWRGDDALRLALERGGETFMLVIELRGANGDARLYGADGSALCALRPGSAGPDAFASDRAGGATERAFDLDWAQLHANGELLLQHHATSELDRHKLVLARALRAEARRETRKLAAIEADAARASEVPALRHRAALVLSNLHALAPGQIEASVLDYGSDPPQPVTLRFDPKLGPKREAEAWFSRARKLERGAVIARERAEASRTRLAALNALAERAEAAADTAALDRVAGEARAFGIGGLAGIGGSGAAEPAPRGRAQPQARLPYREFSGAAHGRSWSGAARRTTTDSPSIMPGRTICGCTRATNRARTWWCRSSAMKPARPNCCAMRRRSARISVRRAGKRARTSSTRSAATCANRASRRPGACS